VALCRIHGTRQETEKRKNRETGGRALLGSLWLFGWDCGEEGFGKWTRGAAMDALSTKRTKFAQGFYIGVWKRWEIGEG
jgi:hypothetical protein